MKIFILSNVSGAVDKALDRLESSGIVAKEIAGTNSQLVSAAADAVAKGTYDLLIVMAKDPIGAGIALNKAENVTAAVCGSEEDVELAKVNGANVMIIRDPDSGELDRILGAAASTAWRGIGKSIPKIRVQAPAKKSAAPRPKQEREPITLTLKMPKIKLFQAKEKEEEPEPELTGPKRSGVVGRLKDWLGVV